MKKFISFLVIISLVLIPVVSYSSNFMNSPLTYFQMEEEVWTVIGKYGLMSVILENKEGKRITIAFRTPNIIVGDKVKYIPATLFENGRIERIK